MLALVGCQLSLLSEQTKTEQLRVGSILTLHHRLAIEPHTAHVYLQHGKRVSGSSVSRVYPSCSFEVNDVSEKPQFIEPGRFRIRSLIYYRRPFGLGQRNTKLFVAGPYVGGLSDNSEEIDFITAMKIKADEDGTEIRNFKCKVTSDSLGRFLSLAEIQEVLGEIATISPTQ
jgi:hypothetical protein